MCFSSSGPTIICAGSKEKITFSKETVIGALAEYISLENEKFQPMNANFGILPSLEINIKDKKQRYTEMANRSLNIIKKYKEIE